MRRLAIAVLATTLVVAPLARPAAAAPADHLTITTVVLNMPAGTTFTVQVVARDASGTVDTAFNGPISLDASATGGANFPGGTFTLSARGGSVTLFGVALNDAADGYTLTASSPGLGNGVSNTFNITAKRLMVTSTTPSMQAGTPFGMQVEARDGNGNLAENFNSNVVLHADADGGSDFAGGSPTTSAAGGIAGFSGLALADAADGYEIRASATGVSAGFRDTFAVTATHLVVAAVANVRAGDPLEVTVEARDANDNVAENFGGNVNVDAAATGGANFAGGTASVAADAGTAMVAGVLNDAADGYTLAASSPGLAPGISNSFDVTARQLAIATAVANVQAGVPFSATVQARDADGNVAENFNGSVALDAVATGGSNFSGGTQNSAAIAGVAVFATLGLGDAADGYTITANTAGLSGATSKSFNVTASHLSMSALTNMRSGDPFSVNVVARDANGNVAENFNADVALDASATGGSNFAGGTDSVPAG